MPSTTGQALHSIISFEQKGLGVGVFQSLGTGIFTSIPGLLFLAGNTGVLLGVFRSTPIVKDVALGRKLLDQVDEVAGIADGGTDGVGRMQVVHGVVLSLPFGSELCVPGILYSLAGPNDSAFIWRHNPWCCLSYLNTKENVSIGVVSVYV